jgi:hypothetical protein
MSDLRRVDEYPMLDCEIHKWNCPQVFISYLAITSVKREFQ